MGYYTSDPEQDWENQIPRTSPIMGARSSAPITPSDTLDIENRAGNPAVCRMLYATGAGNIALVLADDEVTQPVVFIFAAGEIKQLNCKRIMSTNTTATGIVALF